jgi:hypothetical protein
VSSVFVANCTFWPDVVNRFHFLLAVHVAHAHREETQHLRALHLVLDHEAKLLRDRRIGKHFGEMRLVAEDEVDREHTGLRRQGRRVRRRRDHEVDVARAHLLQHLGSCPS